MAPKYMNQILHTNRKEGSSNTIAVGALAPGTSMGKSSGQKISKGNTGLR